MKKYKIIFWVSTIIIFIWEGLMPALTTHTQPAIEGIRHLGYPDYFRVMLTVFKVLGSLAIILPFVNKTLKEWAYAGLTFSLIAAFISHVAVDGFFGFAFFPVVILAILMVSYYSYRKLKSLTVIKKDARVNYPFLETANA